MHLGLILMAVAIAWAVRCVGQGSSQWSDRWQHALSQFLLPPLLLLTTALAVLCMGTQGRMLGLPVGWIGYSLAIGFWGFALAKLLWLLGMGWRSIRQIKALPQATEQEARLLHSPTLFAAQIGFWHPELVVSEGLLATLDADQLHAVLTHEQAHRHYRDTFWFFWLGWVRQLTNWLPQTEALWQELLLLRELRADRWAAERVDPLLLAEALLLVVRAPVVAIEDHCAAFGSFDRVDRLTERIDALIAPQPVLQARAIAWAWLLVAALPLVTLGFHNL